MIWWLQIVLAVIGGAIGHFVTRFFIKRADRAEKKRLDAIFDRLLAERRRYVSAFEAQLSPWRHVFKIYGSTTIEVVKREYRRRARTAHPDHGGSSTEMAQLNQAMAAARRELSPKRGQNPWL